jgi:hypothetical protein
MADKPQPKSGKGDKPRTINNKNWRNNFDQINWGNKKSPKLNDKEPNKMILNEKVQK